MKIDLFETNGGGLCLVDRERGQGWTGFEIGQNQARYRVLPREEFTLASDAPIFDGIEGSAYTRMGGGAVAALYEHMHDHRDAPVKVATWEDGQVTVWVTSPGYAAQWYLGMDAPASDEDPEA
jgi:hypothetical protein